MIHLQIDDLYQPLVSKTLLEKAVLAVLEHQSAPNPSDLTLVLTGDDTLHHLNQQFMNVDAPTDVLSFPSGDLDPESGAIYLGDIIISYPRAEMQASQGGHPVAAELQLLSVHGALHLLGHDHADMEEKSRMWAAQGEILEAIGCPISSPS